MDRELYELQGGDLLAYLRKRAGHKTIAEAARATKGGISRSYLNQLENGTAPTEGMTLRAVLELAETYQVPFDWLCTKLIESPGKTRPNLAHQQQGRLYAPAATR